MRLLERAIAGVDRRMVLLAPAGVALPDHFTNLDFDLDRHTDMLRAVQRFRGGIYLRDGAISSEQLSSDGRHETSEDSQSWHLLMLDDDDRITASAWYCDHHNRVYFDRLRVRHTPLAQAPAWRETLWRAVENELALARTHDLRYAEVGGWAVAPQCRRKGDGLLVALAAYCLGRIVGDTLGITTATVRHGSSSILCRIGGRPLESEGVVVPPYQDDRYRCVMEILRFDSREPSARYRPFVDFLHDRLADVSVVARPYWPMTLRARVSRAVAQATVPDVSFVVPEWSVATA